MSSAVAPLDALFDAMDRWRHFPAYQLERRADIFFAPYLAEVIESYTGIAVEDVIPEFPLRLGTLDDTASNQSVKVDYLVVAKDRSVAFLVELKTDMASRRDSQDERMQRACEIGFGPVLQGLVAIILRSAEIQKYGHLLFALRGLGLVETPADLEAFLFPQRRRGVTERLEQVRVAAGAEMPLRVLYVQPRGEEDGVISFDQFAAHLEGRNDPVSARFRTSLLRWRRPAGAEAPA